MQIDWKQFWKEPEEIVVGVTFAAGFCLWLMWWTALVAVLCGMLWKLGGFKGGDKKFRRIGVPLVIGCAILALGWLPWYVTLGCAGASFGILSCGYGIPDATDEGSAIGRFWLSLLKVPSSADVATRATVGSLFALCWFPLSLAHPGWFSFLFLFLTIGYPMVEECVP